MGKRKYKAGLLLGGNIGKVEQNFAAAHRFLKQHVSILRSSGLYRTEAWGMEDAPDFLNQALLIATGLGPRELLKIVNDVEASLGREREVESGRKGYQSRKLDVDILFYEDRIIDEEDLKIPHPRMHLRNFSLIPLREIAPDWIHPVFEKPVSQLIKESPDRLRVNKE